MEEVPRDPGERHPDLLVSEQERDRAAAALSRHCSEGRLTLEEFSQRVEVVLAARSQRDLDRAMADLPSGVVPYESAVPTSSRMLAIFSGSSRQGRWRPTREVRALAIFGGVDLDLRNAEIDTGEVTITAIAIFGGVDIVVPEGVAVHVEDGFSLFGGKTVKIADVPVLPGAPEVRVRAFPIFGGVDIRTRRPKRRLLDDLHSAIVARSPDARAMPSPIIDALSSLGEPARRSDGHRDEPPLSARDALALAKEILEQMFPRPSGSRPPARGPRPGPGGAVTIVFSDVSGFTEMTERLGDLECQRLLGIYFQIVRGQIATFGGYEVKCHGDEAMLAFADAGQAVRCAIEVQRSLARYNERGDGPSIRAHIGLHAGEAIEDRGDYLGRNVILASRITDAARAEEILVSRELRDLTAHLADLRFDTPRTVSMQGVTEAQELYPVFWS